MITTPLLIVDKIKDLLEKATSYLASLRKENREASNDEDLENHYAQLAEYLSRSKDKTSGAAKYIERKVEKLNEEK